MSAPFLISGGLPETGLLTGGGATTTAVVPNATNVADIYVWSTTSTDKATNATNGILMGNFTTSSTGGSVSVLIGRNGNGIGMDWMESAAVNRVSWQTAIPSSVASPTNGLLQHYVFNAGSEPVTCGDLTVPAGCAGGSYSTDGTNFTQAFISAMIAKGGFVANPTSGMTVGFGTGAGTILRAVMLDGTGKTLYDVDFSKAAVGAASLTDSAGDTWNVNSGSSIVAVSSEPTDATAYALTGPATSTVGSASTYTITPNGTIGATDVVVTPKSTVAGTFSPETVTLPAGSTAAVKFTFTPSAAGAGTLSTTNNGSLTDPAALNITENNPEEPSTAYTMEGSSTAAVGGEYEIDLAPNNGGPSADVTVTLSDGGAGGSFSSDTVTFPANSTATQTVKYTPAATGTVKIAATNSGSLTDPANLSVVVSSAVLTCGYLDLTADTKNITVSLTAAPSGGTAPYTIALYRATRPNPSASETTLLSSDATFPYVDTPPTDSNVPPEGEHTQYFYAAKVTDASGTVFYVVPDGLWNFNPTALTFKSTSLRVGGINIVFVGDSITFGANSQNGGTVKYPTLASYAMDTIGMSNGLRVVNGSNQGQLGYTLNNFQPDQAHYAAVKSAMSGFMTSNPDYECVFSTMLGTNDSAYGAGSVGSTPAEFIASYKTMINQLLVDFPLAKIVCHMSPYYTPNTANGASYLQQGLDTLYSYRAAMRQMVKDYSTSNPGSVFLGDTVAFAYTADNYRGVLFADSTTGQDGTFYLHPTSNLGQYGTYGTEELGRLHGMAIARALWTSSQATVSGRSYVLGPVVAG